MSTAISRRRRIAHVFEMLERRVLLASFPGVSLQDEFTLLGGGPTTSPCPDTMGAVGPNHFVETIKGAVAIFHKTTGARLSIQTMANFYSLTIGGTQYPRSAISDRRLPFMRSPKATLSATFMCGKSA